MKAYVFFALAFCLISSSVSAQEIIGRWRSSDNTRIYRIYSKGDDLEAVLEKSTRKRDKPGTLILTLIERKKRGRYKGLIRAVDDGMTTIAVLKLKGKNNDILKLRLRRFGIGVTVKWYRQF